MRVARWLALLAGLIFGTASILGCVPEPTPASGWVEVTAAPTARGELDAVVIGDRLYVLGGLTSATAGATDRVEVYDFTSREWQTVAPQRRSTGRFTSSAAARASASRRCKPPTSTTRMPMPGSGWPTCHNPGGRHERRR